MAVADNQLIVVVEGTAALGFYWPTIVSDYIEKIVRAICSNELPAQKPAAAAASVSSFEFALVMFNTHGSYSGCVVQRSSWTKDAESFLKWLSSISFCGGGLDDVAIAEGLSEALMMFSINQNGCQTHQTDGKRHCILIAANNPYPLPTPVYRPKIEIPEKGEDIETEGETYLFEAETVAQWFGQCSVSLSVICPKQLMKLRAIYNAGKRNPRAADPPIDVKQPYFLVLISDSFMEAKTALSQTGLTTDQSSLSSLPPSSAPPASLSSVNPPIMNRPAISGGNVPQAVVKVEPSTLASHMPTVPRATAQIVASPSLQTSSPQTGSQDKIANNEPPDMKPLVSMSQTLRPVGAILNNLSARVMSSALAGNTSLGLPSMGGNPISMHMSNMISSGMASSISPQTVMSTSGQSGLTAMNGPGSITGTSQPMQNGSLSSLASTPPTSVSGNTNIGTQQASNVQGGVSMGQPVPGISQGNVPQMSQGPNSVNSNIMGNPNMGVTGASSAPPGTMIPTPGMSQQVQHGMQSVGMNNNPAANMPMSQQASALPSAQSKYVKVWEGNLSGQRQGQPVFITRLEGYRNATASESLAANWPQVMQIVRLISQDHMNNKQYVGKADFLVFRAMNQHGFLQQLQEKKLCAVIQLPSQTLLLSVSDKACRLIGMLFPGDMVVFKASQQQQMQQQQQNQQIQQASNQQQQQHPHQLQQQPHLLSLQQQQQQQQLQQLQQHQAMQQQQQQVMQQQGMQQQQQQAMQQQQGMQQQQQAMQQQQVMQQQQQIPQMQQPQQLQQQQSQQIPQVQQQQPSSAQHMIGGGGVGMAAPSSYVQSRPQLIPQQGQAPSQGSQSLPGGGLLG